MIGCCQSGVCSYWFLFRPFATATTCTKYSVFKYSRVEVHTSTYLHLQIPHRHFTRRDSPPSPKKKNKDVYHTYIQFSIIFDSMRIVSRFAAKLVWDLPGALSTKISILLDRVRKKWITRVG